MTSYLVQVLLPIADNHGKAFPNSVFEDVKNTLVDVFGGVTAYARSPAEGVWASDQADNKPSGNNRSENKHSENKHSENKHDDIIIVEVMAREIDAAWWAQFRSKLEHQLRQQEIVVRAFPIRILDRH